MKHLLLNGFMATGKSTLGPIVASELGLPFVDLDEAIERKAGKGIGELFRDDGEDRFRDLESSALTRTLQGEPSVIAGGGGILQSDANRRIAEERALIVTLTCPLEELARRAAADGPELRPVLFHPLTSAGDSGLGAVQALLTRRAWLYDAYPTVATNGTTPELASATVIETYQRYHEGRDGAAYELPFPGSEASQIVFASLTDRAGIDWLANNGPSMIALVTDTTVHEVLGKSLVRELTEAHREPVVVSIAPGEDQKSLNTLETVYGQLQRAELDRRSTLVALGGGVIGDIGGFAAATYLRGLRLVNVPTTLLAQVDAAIGGKTGVDFGGVKNIIGSLYPAQSVVIDTDTLRSLSASRLREGLAEMVKIAFIRDPGLMKALESLSGAEEILDRPDLIRRSVRNKVEVVKADPRETTGQRAALNFGHTVGHAIESAGGYRISHGECVAMGMVVETELAVSLGCADSSVLDRLVSCLARFDLPTSIPSDQAGTYEANNLIRLIRQDKKSISGNIRVVILEEAGGAALRPVDESHIRAVLRPKAFV